MSQDRGWVVVGFFLAWATFLLVFGYDYRVV